MIQQCITLFFAGTDTTSTLLAAAIYELSANQDVQRDLKRENKAVIGDKHTVEHADLSKLTLLNAFIKECLRLHPPAPGLLSRLALENHYIKDLHVKKGWRVNYSVFGTYANDRYFHRPEQFSIQRWLDSNQDDNFTFVPFSAGPRNCIG